MATSTTEQLATIRDLLDRADRWPTTEGQIGSLLLAVSKLTDLVEAQDLCITELEQGADAIQAMQERRR